MKLCLFFGTFNPIHNAHLRMAEFVLEQFNFDKILFVPAGKPPHKEVANILPIHRLKMVELAIGNNPKFEVSDIEYRLENTSYTYLTILELQKIYGDSQRFNFIIGTDAFEKIESWYEVEKLKNQLNFIVSVRENEPNLERFNYLREKGFEFSFTTLDFCDISSTELREKISFGQSVSDFVPGLVEEYINENGLYR